MAVSNALTFASIALGFYAILAGSPAWSQIREWRHVPQTQQQSRAFFGGGGSECDSFFRPRHYFQREPLQKPTKPTPLKPEAHWGEIFDAWKEIKSKISNENLIRPTVDARRLIHPDQWGKTNVRQLDSSLWMAPWLVYGTKTIQNYFNLVRFIRSAGTSLTIDSQLLKKMHSIAMDRLPFHGFEGRRLLQKLKDKEIDLEAFRDLTQEAYQRNAEIAGVPHQSLVAQFRNDPIDEIEHHGSSFDPNGRRYFSNSELATLRENGIIQVDLSLLTPYADGFRGKVYYAPVQQVEPLVAAELKSAAWIWNEISSNPPEDLGQFVRSVVQIERNLISIHPFLDGNGRTIRGLSDLLYFQAGLPPPLEPNENDLTMTLEQNVEWTRRQMIASANAWAQALHEVTDAVQKTPGFQRSLNEPTGIWVQRHLRTK